MLVNCNDNVKPGETIRYVLSIYAMMAKTERCISMTFHAFDLNSLTGGNK